MSGRFPASCYIHPPFTDERTAHGEVVIDQKANFIPHKIPIPVIICPRPQHVDCSSAILRQHGSFSKCIQFKCFHSKFL
jgi:hypothetical protein